MRTSEVLKSLLCNPEGVVCIKGSTVDLFAIQEALKCIEKMEICLQSYADADYKGEYNNEDGGEYARQILSECNND